MAGSSVAKRRTGRKTTPAPPGTPASPTAPGSPDTEASEFSSAASQYAEMFHAPIAYEPEVAPSTVKRGVVAFDMDGTILDDIGLIGDLAGDVLNRAFGTPAEEGRQHYLATTGMPFEAQLSQLYPSAPPELRDQTAKMFHQRKVTEAYADARPFPEIPKLLKRLSTEGWTLVISTGAEREMADLMLEREGLRFWFEAVLGSGQGTKREHVREYQRRYPGVPVFLVGDSRFDMEVGSTSPGVVPLGRASSIGGWTLSPDDLKRWGAVWADYSLARLPEELDRLARSRGTGRPPPASGGGSRKKR